jgi:hypothetical protein
MTSKNAATTNERRRGEDLDGRYGKIGIPAVAAALPYGCDSKNPAYAPVAPRPDNERVEAAAA